MNKDTVIEIDIPNNKSDSELSKIEMKYSVKIDLQLGNVVADCIRASKYHDKKALYFKQMNLVLGLPSILLILICGMINPLLSDNLTNKIVITSFLIIAAILSTVDKFFNSSKKREQHLQYSGLYLKLKNDLQSELVKDTNHRMPADVLLSSTTIKLNNLNLTAPN